MKRILFTNRQDILAREPGFSLTVGNETYTIDEVRPALGTGTLQINALTVRREDNAAVISASIPKYMEVQGRLLNAYCTLCLSKFPKCLQPYVQHYVGQTRMLRSVEDQSLIRGRDGRTRLGHEWKFEGHVNVNSIQLREGFALCLVENPRLSNYQPEDEYAAPNYTIDFKMILSQDATFGPWTRPITRVIEDTVVEQEFVLDAVAGDKPKSAGKKGKNSALF